MRLGLAVSVAVVAVAVVGAQGRKVDFEQEAIGEAPKGFAFGQTRKVGTPGRWVVQQDGGGKYLAQVGADATRNRFAFAVLSDVSAADIDLSVRVRPVAGRVDQAAGLVWRYQNEDNYYIVRANALEDNVVLYKVQNGERTDLPVIGEGRTYGKPAEVPAGRWSTLRVVARGARFEVQFNGRRLFEVEDSTFSRPGRVGVWTKADSVTHFDDLLVTIQ